MRLRHTSSENGVNRSVDQQSATFSKTPKDGDTALRQRTGKHENLEQALFLWISAIGSKNAIINDDVLIEKAKKFGIELGVQDF